MRYIGTGEISPAVSAGEFRRATHLEDGEGADDAGINELLAGAQDVVSRATGLPLLGQYEFIVPLMPGWSHWYFPCRPVAEILDLSVNDDDDNWQSISMSGWRLSCGHDEPTLTWASGWAPDGVSDWLRVQALVGSAPEPTAKRAIIRLAKEWLDADTSIEGDQMAPRVSFGAMRLVKQIRYRRPREFC